MRFSGLLRWPKSSRYSCCLPENDVKNCMYQSDIRYDKPNRGKQVLLMLCYAWRLPESLISEFSAIVYFMLSESADFLLFKEVVFRNSDISVDFLFVR